MRHEKFIKDTKRNAAKAVKAQETEAPDPLDFKNYDQAECPYCKSSKLLIERPRGEDDEIVREISCQSCGAGWSEVYELVDIF